MGSLLACFVLLVDMFFNANPMTAKTQYDYSQKWMLAIKHLPVLVGAFMILTRGRIVSKEQSSVNLNPFHKKSHQSAPPQKKKRDMSYLLKRLE